MTKKQRGAEKFGRTPAFDTKEGEPLKKPDWIRVKLPNTDAISKISGMLRDKQLYSVCEEASCPNLAECFNRGTATFMIMGDMCTRRCSFCDVAHGKPEKLDLSEPKNLADTVAKMGLRYVVITSVNRDDLRDGGANHYAECVGAIRQKEPNIKIEILVPDFRGRMEKALDGLEKGLPDVFNHNIETIPRLYKQVRSGADYDWSLRLLFEFKKYFSKIPTKSGLMLGLGETNDEVKKTLNDLRANNVDMLTLGQYLQPSSDHVSVNRYVTPDEFKELKQYAKELGFLHVASGPLVRSSYHADKQVAGEDVF